MGYKRPAKRTIPKILIDRRPPGYRDRISKRDWSRNPLGPAFLKKPENLRMGRFHSSGEGGSPAEYKMHKLLEQKIRVMIKARPFREYGLVFYKGESGAFYIRLRSISSNEKPVYIKVNKPSIARAIGFLFK